jgi:Uma2 family endonuclease
MSQIALPSDREAQAAVPEYVVDLASFRHWAHSESFPERGTISFLAGEIDVDMNAEEIETHNKVKRDLAGGLWTYLNAVNTGELLADGVLLVNEAANLSTEPDLLFCRWDSLRSGRVQYTESVEDSDRLVEVRGTPDVVVEIISRYSVRKDTKILPSLYFAAGIPEYWLIDARGKKIDFRMQVRAADGYEAVAPDADGYRTSPMLEQAFLVTREQNPVGRFRYRLHYRPPVQS